MYCGGTMNASPSLPSQLPRPADDLTKQDELVTRLRGSRLFRDYQHAFETATGMPLVLRAAGSFQPPLRGSAQMNPFCAMMAATSKTCASCLELQQRVEDAAAAGSSTLQCFAGLTESAVPVRIGAKVVAYLQTGQVMLRPPTEKGFRTATSRLDKAAGPDMAQAHAAYFRTRVLTKTHYDAMVRLLASFAEHLSLVINELVMQQTTAEPPAVSRARTFIAEHLGEQLCLQQVARASNMSAFYFCKVFKGATGLTFTDYVGRARVEHTKQRLLNPNVRISEAAYEAGFQSLSQFNRVFRRIAGEAPTAYRERIHGTNRISAAPAPLRALPFAA
ncbi:MAG: hypothetical protein RIQ93_1900 [Verrucomicrobiota bacterium]|jgi:AraC-like DNA-binding protein/ligand-binding sensor protein